MQTRQWPVPLRGLFGYTLQGAKDCFDKRSGLLIPVCTGPRRIASRGIAISIVLVSPRREVKRMHLYRMFVLFQSVSVYGLD